MADDRYKVLPGNVGSRLIDTVGKTGDLLNVSTWGGAHLGASPEFFQKIAELLNDYDRRSAAEVRGEAQGPCSWQAEALEWRRWATDLIRAAGLEAECGLPKTVISRAVLERVPPAPADTWATTSKTVIARAVLDGAAQTAEADAGLKRCCATCLYHEGPLDVSPCILCNRNELAEDAEVDQWEPQ